VKKGEFKEGDLCVYCEIDSVLPERPEFEFLRPRNFRIRTAKLRGQVSQGIAFPISILKHVGTIEPWPSFKPGVPPLLMHPEVNGLKFTKIVEGEDVTEVLGVTKYDPPIPAELSGVVKGKFPSHSIKTDEERIQNLKDNFDKYRQERWFVTEKLDGSSMTCFIYENEFGISSRNLTLKENDTNSLWKVARQLEIEGRMREYMIRNNLEALTLQGEIIGEGIQKNKYKLKGQTVKLFRAFDPMKYQFFPYGQFMVMMLDMDLDTVPILETDFELPETYEELIAYADGRSALADTAREGIVFVAKNPSYSDSGRLSFKVISNKFLLKHGE
jgi:RNA ligase (TIGR02306 family)